MVIIHSKLSNFVITITYTHMCRKLTNWGHLMVHNNNQEAREMWLSLPAIQKVHKVNGYNTSPRHSNLSEHVPIQIWYIKLPHTSINHHRVPKFRLQQFKNQIWVIRIVLQR